MKKAKVLFEVTENQYANLISLLELGDNDIPAPIKGGLVVACPKCKSQKTRLISSETLYTGEHPSVFDKQTYCFDDEVYSTASCDDCNHEFSVDGTITWKES